MNLSRAALIAAIATTVAWVLKAVAIGTAGGDERAPLAGPLFLTGLALCVTASVLLGLTFAARRGPLGKVVGAVLAAVAVIAFTLAENVVLNAIAPAHPGWVWGEINLWVLMLLLVAVASAAVVRRRTTAAPAVVAPVR